MKNLFLIITSFAVVPVFGQRMIPYDTIKGIEARMTDLKSSLFLVDSLYEDYLSIGTFTIQEGAKSNLSEIGSTWIYNRYAALAVKYPKQCPECKTKADKVMRLIDREVQVEMDVQYQKVINKADDCFQKQDFSKAKEYYQRAVNFRPSDPYPKQKLEEVDAILAEQEKK